MKRFIYVDHYIREGDMGHHLPYAEMILEAALKKGWETVLITNADFDPGAAAARSPILAQTLIFPAYNLHLQTTPVLEYYNRHISQRLYQVLQIGWLKKLVKAIYFNISGIDREGLRAAKQFKQDTARAFHEIQLKNGDVVFFSYALEEEAEHILHLICEQSISHQASYHLQLWKVIFDEIGQRYTHDDPVAVKIKKSFRKYLKRPADQRITLYTDSVERSAQYEFVLGRRVKTLPLPPNLKTNAQAISSAMEGEPNTCTPLKIITPGSPRIEKGFLLMPDIVAALWETQVATGQACFEMQVNNTFNKWDPVVSAIHCLESYPAPGIRLLKQHMTGEEYAAYIASGDICLLPYKREDYFVRTSGPFSEAISVGIPVLVPNLSWMSRQLKEPAYQYLNHIADTIGHSHIRYHYEPCPDSRDHKPQFGPVKVHASICLIRLLIPEEEKMKQNQYLKVTIRCLDLEKNCIRTDLKYLETSRSQAAVLTLRVDPEAAFIIVNLDSFLETEPMVLASIEVIFVDKTDMPCGVIGLCYDHENEIPALLDEMIHHYGHYKKTANAFSQRWNSLHNPQALVDLILEGSEIEFTD